jgi:hypothetical protein
VRPREKERRTATVSTLAAGAPRPPATVLARARVSGGAAAATVALRVRAESAAGAATVPARARVVGSAALGFEAAASDIDRTRLERRRSRLGGGGSSACAGFRARLPPVVH